MIITKDLTRRFNGNVAVDRLNLEVAEGEIFGLLGPNGAGKTTTERTCLIAPTSGEATINGYRVGTDDKTIRGIVGVLTESPGLYERLDAYTNLEFYADLYDVENPAKQVEKYLNMLDLWERRKEPVAGFSKGMKQKLAIARALIHEPKVLFLDEPTSALDPQAAKVVRDFVEELKHQGRTIFLCTHNLDEAKRLCDRIAVVKTRLVALDTAENLEHSMFGRRTQIRLRQVTPAMAEAIRQIEGVQRVEQANGQLTVALADPEAVNPLIVRALVGLGADIIQVSEQEHSLEEVYLNLIKEAA
jgi:ABC-2 type transport system ATP-binding protein